MSVLMAKLLSRPYRSPEPGEDGDGSDTVGTGNDARLALLNKINDQNDSVSAAGGDLQDVNDDGTTQEFTVQTAEGEKTSLVEGVETEEKVVVAPTQTSPLITIKVNGKEEQITQEELIARAQKNSAADENLAEAARLRAEAEARAAAQRGAQVQEQVVDDLALARAIQMGSEEEAVAAIRTLKAPALSPDVLARTVDDRLAFNDAISVFRRDYSDIAGNDRLNKMAQEMDAELIKNGDIRPYNDRYAAIGTSIRDWVKSLSPAVKTDEKPIPVVDKQTRKENVQAVPRSTGGKTASTLEEEKEESNSEIIAGMAKSRGGPQWMRGLNS